MVNSGPEDADAGFYLLFISEKANLVPAFVLQVLIHVRRNAQMTRNVKMIVRRLKILNPAAPRDANCGVAEKVNVRRGIGLQRSDEDQRDIVGSEPLRAEDILRKLRLGANDLRFRISEKTEPCLVDDVEILRGTGVDEDVATSAADEVDEDVHFLALVPRLHPIHLGAGNPECAGIESLNRVLHAAPPCWAT